MYDQVDNLLNGQICVEVKPGRECLSNKAADVSVNTITARSEMGPHSLQGISFCHVTTSSPENVVQDHHEVYDVAHHASNILLAGKQEESEHLVGDTFRCSLTCLDIHRKPSPRACLQIHSSCFRQLNSPEMSTHNVIHLPRRCATSWYGQIFDDVGHIYFELFA